MAAPVDLPEPDRLDGAPHPRETAHVFGHADAEAEMLRAHASGRMHHAWLMTGARGVGKATLAWRFARFILATPPNDGGMFAPPPPQSLDIAADHPVARRMLQLTESRLFLLRRGANQTGSALSADIRVDEVRRMKSFFALSAADGGARVAIIDAADDMNTGAANAVLKLLEEPPKGVTFLVVAHQPHRLLPTIRSRCRELRLHPLAPEPLAGALAQAGGEVAPAQVQALSALAAGSVGEAFRLTHLDGLATYQALVTLLGGLPRLDRPRALSLAESGAGKGAEERFDLINTLLDLLLSRIARAGVSRVLPTEAARGEADLITRLAPHTHAARAWAELAQTLSLRARRGKAVNLDPAALLMDSFLKLEETAATLALK